jgi:hypothetical protein
MTRNLTDRVPMLLVRMAASMVPRAERADWVAEWAGELWQVRRLTGETGEPRTQPIRFAFGALRDAFFLGRNRASARGRAIFAAGSAPLCILILAALALNGVLACWTLPHVRATLLPLPYRDSSNLVLISRFGAMGRNVPNIRMSEYREWQTNTAPLYDGIAYYSTEAATLHIRHEQSAGLVVAVASANLLDLLGAGARGFTFWAPASINGPRLILMQSVWTRRYHRDPALPGRTASIRGQQVTLAGVMPDSAWRLPMRTDAVLLEDSRGAEQLPPTLRGFVIARIRPAAFAADLSRPRSMVESRDGVVLHYACVSLGELATQPAQVLACCMVLALLGLPIIAAVSLGEYPMAREALRAQLILRRWLFVGAKFILVTLAIAAWSSVLAFCGASADLSLAAGNQALIALLPLLAGFRWVLQDQRDRCPVCMLRLSHPARVGQPSWSFLGWYGTEMICSRGHGLLHIPELPTSWFGAQRWLGLDASWAGLFGDAGAQR